MNTQWIYRVVLVMGLSMAGCATVPLDPEDRAEFEALNDPLEPMNRTVLDVNMKIDEWLLEPIARGYRHMMPEFVQQSVHNVLNNLRSPLILANEVLQGETERAVRTVARFMVNSTVGLFGIFDVAAKNLPFRNDDFGQTLAVWGIGEGPYLVLPLLGPSTLRDTVGFGVDFYTDPTDLFLDHERLHWAVNTRLGLNALDTRAGLLEPMDDLKRTSLDFYAAMRSVYRQRRQAEIKGNEP